MKHLALYVFVICVCATTSLAQAQDTRMVDVDGHQMRVRTAGIGSAGPVVVFEAGGTQGLTTWRSVFQDVAEFAAVVAYDRAGTHGSESDGELPTPRHVAENLHALLEQVGAEPPYVLVGHSLGGPYIRMFTGMYPEEVGGLVYVDPTTITTEQEQRALDAAQGFSVDDLHRFREEWSPPDAQGLTGVAAESAVIGAMVTTYFAEFHALPPVPDVPIAVLMAGRSGGSRWLSEPGGNV